jgi:hypothetical protein
MAATLAFVTADGKLREDVPGRISATSSCPASVSAFKFDGWLSYSEIQGSYRSLANGTAAWTLVFQATFSSDGGYGQVNGGGDIDGEAADNLVADWNEMPPCITSCDCPSPQACYGGYCSVPDSCNTNGDCACNAVCDAHVCVSTCNPDAGSCDGG